MSILLAPPRVVMRSPPSSRTDFKDLKYRAARATSVHPSNRSPQLLHRPLGGRISRPKSNPSLSLSLRNQQAVWETAIGRNWTSERLDPNPEAAQSLQYIAPQSLTVSPSHSAASSTNGINLDSISTVITTVGSAAEPVENRELLRYADANPPDVQIAYNAFPSSMEFMMPPNYNHFGSYPSSYQSSSMGPPTFQSHHQRLTRLSGYMDLYPEAAQEEGKARVTSPPTSYASSYTAATSPPLVQANPALSPRGGSIERDVRDSGLPYAYADPGAVRAPYEAATTAPPNYSYAHAPPAVSTAYTPAFTTSVFYRNLQSIFQSDPLTAPRSHDPYANSQYHSGYPQHSSSYMHPPPSGYSSTSYSGSSGYHIQAVPRRGERVVEPSTIKPKPECWDHGCNGKPFSTLSNLLRHQREKSGQSTKSECPRCHAIFTRKTARDGHLIHDKCRPKNGSEHSN